VETRAPITEEKITEYTGLEASNFAASKTATVAAVVAHRAFAGGSPDIALLKYL